jgi:hypothetical protein
LSWISSNSRTFSIAIAAWSAKVDTSSICLSVKRPHLGAAQRQNADRDALAQHRHAEQGAKATKFPSYCKGVVRVGLDIGNMDDLAFKQRASGERAPVQCYRHIFDLFQEFRREPVRFGAIEHTVALAGDRPMLRVAKPRG